MGFHLVLSSALIPSLVHILFCLWLLLGPDSCTHTVLSLAPIVHARAHMCARACACPHARTLESVLTFAVSWVVSADTFSWEASSSRRSFRIYRNRHRVTCLGSPSPDCATWDQSTLMIMKTSLTINCSLPLTGISLLAVNKT